MEIRLATADDIPSLVEFNQAMAMETEGKALDTETLTAGVSAVLADKEKGSYVVIEDESNVVAGLLITREWSDWRNAWFWWIQSVYVRPTHRGTGLYSQMYQYVKQLATDAGDVCGFRLYVEKDNERARKVYEKLGMEETYYLMYEE